MKHHKHINEIEAGIEQERASLVSTLDTLQNRVSVENLAEDALGIIRTNVTAYTHAFDTAVRSNPMALALTGIGIAWLVFGKKKAADGSPSKSGNRNTQLEWTDGYDDGEDHWSHQAESLRDRAIASLQKVEDEAKSYAAQMRDGLSDGLDSVRDFAVERAGVVSDFTADLKQSFAHGLDGLSDAAADRITSVRQSAYEARLRAEQLARDGGRGAGLLVQDHPIVAGGVALGIGAALAAAFPRTGIEDRTFGAKSDELMAEAARLLRQERDTATRIAGGVVEELKDAAKSTLASVSDNVASTVDAVKDRATTELDDLKADGETANVPD